MALRTFFLGAPRSADAPASRSYVSEDGELTVDDGTPPAPSFRADLAVALPEDSGSLTQVGDELLSFEAPTQSPGFSSFVLADEPLARPRLAHPRLVPRAQLASRTRFPRASSPMATPDPDAAIGLPSPVALPKGAPMFVRRR